MVFVNIFNFKSKYCEKNYKPIFFYKPVQNSKTVRTVVETFWQSYVSGSLYQNIYLRKE